MKSNFSRFLHHTLSHSDVREVFTSSLSLSDLIGESRSNQVADLSNLDYRVKPDNDGFCTGRSMVEMLGVLAIIGVLSVGAIAGYSKAMMKYKLNKQSEQLNTVINTIARNIHSFDNLHASGGNTPDLTRYFIKMGEIPTEMVQNTGFLKDVFGIQWASFINSTDTHIFLEGIAPVLKTKSADNLAICQNVILTAKENSDNIWDFITASTDSGSSIGRLFGNDECLTGRQCLKDVTLDDIYTICNKQIGTRHATFQIRWKIHR